MMSLRKTAKKMKHAMIEKSMAIYTRLAVRTEIVAEGASIPQGFTSVAFGSAANGAMLAIDSFTRCRASSSSVRSVPAFRLIKMHGITAIDAKMKKRAYLKTMTGSPQCQYHCMINSTNNQCLTMYIRTRKCSVMPTPSGSIFEVKIGADLCNTDRVPQVKLLLSKSNR